MIPSLIAIDPGVRCTGVACFIDGALFNVSGYYADRVVVACSFPSLVRPRDSLAIEVPQIYKVRRTDANDLIDVALVAGAWISRYKHVQIFRPAEWKGQAPKKIVHERIRERLSEGEREVLDRDLRSVPKSLQHNALDAVGIGLHALGRL